MWTKTFDPQPGINTCVKGELFKSFFARKDFAGYCYYLLSNWIKLAGGSCSFGMLLLATLLIKVVTCWQLKFTFEGVIGYVPCWHFYNCVIIHIICLWPVFHARLWIVVESWASKFEHLCVRSHYIYFIIFKDYTGKLRAVFMATRNQHFWRDLRIFPACVCWSFPKPNQVIFFCY